jgi:hypothetical protein
MDFESIISSFLNNTINTSDVKGVLNEQLEEIQQKLNFLYVVEVASNAQKMIDSGAFIEHEITSVEVFRLAYRNPGSQLFTLKRNGNAVSEMELPTMFYSKAESIFDQMTSFSSSEMQEKALKPVEFELNEKFKENFIDTFISKKLKTMISFHQLQQSIPTNKIENIRHKI